MDVHVGKFKQIGDVSTETVQQSKCSLINVKQLLWWWYWKSFKDIFLSPMSCIKVGLNLLFSLRSNAWGSEPVDSLLKEAWVEKFLRSLCFWDGWCLIAILRTLSKSLWLMFDCDYVSTLFMLLNPLSTSVVDNSQVILTIVCQH